MIKQINLSKFRNFKFTHIKFRKTQDIPTVIPIKNNRPMTLQNISQFLAKTGFAKQVPWAWAQCRQVNIHNSVLIDYKHQVY